MASGSITKSAVAELLCGGYGVAVGFIGIPCAYALSPGIGHHGYGRIAKHASGICVEHLPAFVIAVTALTGETCKRIDHVADHARIDKRLERKLRPEDVPATEDGAFCKACVGRMDFVVAANVAAVAVGIGARINHCVIERSVEHGAVVSRSPLDTDSREGFVPAVGGATVCLVETETGNLSLEIAACSFNIDKRKTNLHIHLLALFCGKLGEKAYMPATHGYRIAHDAGCCHTLKIAPAHHIVALTRPV